MDVLISRRFGPEPRAAAEQLQHSELPAWHETPRPLPVAPGKPPFRLPLGSVIPDPTDTLVLHTVGDTGGVLDPHPQRKVVAAMAAASPRPHLFFHNGDIVYFNGRRAAYFPQFYEANEILPWPIIAIPGNHDGDDSDDPTVPSLSGFMANFCTPRPILSPDAKDVRRDTMTQPSCYFTLTANLATIIGLYTNVPSGGYVDAQQHAWLASELAAAPTDRALVVALHHPPYSMDAHHGGSAFMGAMLDSAFQTAGRTPDLVLSGHVHNYQRFTRRLGDRSVAYIVAGAGGYHNLHAMASGLGALPYTPAGSQVTLDYFDSQRFGFVTLYVTKSSISGFYSTVAGTALKDTFTIPLAGR